MAEQENFWDDLVKKQGLPDYKAMPNAKDYWDALSRKEDVPQDAIVIGQHTESDSKVYLPLKAFSTHIHVIGATNTGKSYFMEALLRDIISRGHGVCLIDPHNQLYQNMVNYLSHFPELAEKVILFNPGQKEDKFVGFNPLRQSRIFPEISTQVKYITVGAAKVWEEESKNTPLLRRNMGNMLFPLIEGGWTMRQAEAFIDLESSAKRRVLVNCTKRERVLRDWQTFERMTLSQKLDKLGSLQNRMPEFLDSKAVRYTIGRIKNVLDVEDIIENGKILLCNFSANQNLLSDDDAYMLGVLLVNEMTNYAKSCRTREMARARPFYLFIDELQNFLSPDIGEILDECRKFGLHMVLAHQHLAQLRSQAPLLYHSVMTNARTKVIFGGLTWDDLEILEKEVFAGTHNLKEIKEEIRQRVVVDYDIKEYLVRGGSSSSSWSHSESNMEGSSDAETMAQMFSESGNPEAINPVLYTMQGSSSGVSSGHSRASGESDSEGHSESRSWSQVPMLIPVMDEVTTSRQFYNLDEQRYKNIVKLKQQPTQFAYIKVLEKPPVPVKITHVVDFVADEEKQQKLHEISYQQNERYYMTEEEIEAEFVETDNKIQKLLDDEKKEPEDFRE